MKLGAGIFLAEKWIRKAIGVSMVSDRILLVRYWFKVLFFKLSKFVSRNVFKVKVRKIIFMIVFSVLLASSGKRELLSQMQTSKNMLKVEQQPSQSAFTCSKLAIETLEQGVKYVQS